MGEGTPARTFDDCEGFYRIAEKTSRSGGPKSVSSRRSSSPCFLYYRRHRPLCSKCDVMLRLVDPLLASPQKRTSAVTMHFWHSFDKGLEIVPMNTYAPRRRLCTCNVPLPERYTGKNGSLKLFTKTFFWFEGIVASAKITLLLLLHAGWCAD